MPTSSKASKGCVMRAKARWFLLVGAGAFIVVAVAGRNTGPARMLRRGVEVAARKVRYAKGRLEGLRYRLAGGRPDSAVSDDVLADRIRSSLGPIEKRLDVPRVHVMVEDHVALLHGAVPSTEDAHAIERAARAVVGVRGVASYLHVGLGAGDTRPSAGRSRAMQVPSPALHELLDAACDVGVPDALTSNAVRAVLGTFADRLPSDEREQLFAHLPADVRELAALPRHHGETGTRWRTVTDLLAAITAEGVESANAEAIARTVLGHLRRLVPEETADVAAVLPAELRELWETAAAS